MSSGSKCFFCGHLSDLQKGETMEQKLRKIVLEDGSVYYGKGFGADREVVAELVFNTSMVGYQEIISDPSYTGQAVVMTYPLIGNYGINEEDDETLCPTIDGLVVREYNDHPSNFRCSETLHEKMVRYNIAGVSDIDTRMLARHIRSYGSCKVLITDASTSDEQAMEVLKNSVLPNDAVSRVSAKEITVQGDENSAYRIVAIDCGMKQNIVRMMVKKGMQVTVVPWNTSADEILAMNPDGVFISNGPGDPTDVEATIQTVRQLIGKKPIFGICLGHQIISLAYGAKTYKLKFGHRGGNHPVRNVLTDRVEITSQNHSYAVDQESLQNTKLEMTHENLLDHTIEGVRCKADHVFSVQYHPESAPGPQDSSYLFGVFKREMDEWKEEHRDA